MAETTPKIYITRNHIFYTALIFLCLILPLGLLTQYYYLPFALVIALMTGVVILRNPYIGLLMYTILLLIRPQEFILLLENSPVPVERSFGVFLLIIAFQKLFQSKFRFRLTSIDKGLIAFVSVTMLSIITSIYISRSLETWIDILRLFIVYFFIVVLIDTPRQLKFYILFVIICSAFHSSASIVNYYSGNYMNNIAMHIDRAIGIDKSFAAPNSLAATMVYNLPFIYFYFVSEKSIIARFLLVFIVPSIIWCIILTGSRSGMVGIIFTVLLIVWERKNKIRNIFIAILALACIWIIMPSQYRDRFESTTDLTSGSASAVSANARVDGFIKGAKMMLDKPFLGYGVGSYATASATIYDPGNWHEAHNLYGQMLGEVGLLGTAAFTILIYLLLKELAKLRAKLGLDSQRFLYNTVVGLKVQLLCLLFMGLSGHNLYRYNWFMLAALVTVMMRLGASGIYVNKVKISPV